MFSSLVCLCMCVCACVCVCVCVCVCACQCVRDYVSWFCCFVCAICYTYAPVMSPANRSTHRSPWGNRSQMKTHRSCVAAIDSQKPSGQSGNRTPKRRRRIQTPVFIYVPFLIFTIPARARLYNLSLSVRSVLDVPPVPFLNWFEIQMIVA